MCLRLIRDAHISPNHTTADHILERPHTDFDTLKHVYPNYIHGRDLSGNAISVEQPGPLEDN